MTENMNKFLELVSNEGEEYRDKLAKATKEELIAMAAEKGVTLTDADFGSQAEEGEISIDEAEAVAGGKKCYCVAGGHGGYTDRDRGEDDLVCICCAYGQGEGNKRNHKGLDTVTRCRCIGTGEGKCVV